MASVRLEHITRQFGEIAAIGDISFTVPDGEFWVLVGPSGCGKSTLLRTIAGLETATSGELYIGDRLVNHLPARQRDVAMVFQNYALYPHMSVFDNLGFGLKMRQTDPKILRERVEAVAQLLGIGHLLARKPKQLSGGQQQRVALGRAIVRQPQVFLLDEPLSNLDAQLRDDTRAELKQLHQQVGITTIYVTHDQVEAMTLADQIVVLDQGKVQQIGSPQDIYKSPANRMVATFLGNPPMNILPVQWTGSALRILASDDGAFSGQEIACPAEWKCSLEPGTRLDLGIRPEHLYPQVDLQAGQIATIVTVVEPLGRESLVRAAVVHPDREPTQPPTILQLQVPPDMQLQVGDRLGLDLDWQQLCCFEADTGDLIQGQPVRSNTL